MGLFDSPVSDRHVLCLHVGEPVPVSYRAGRYERDGVRIHGQFCVVPAQLDDALDRVAAGALAAALPGSVGVA